MVMNNQIYGLTTGQVSPTSRVGQKTKSTPFGSVEYPLNPLTSAIMNGATYVARGYSGDVRHLTELIKGGIEHQGFALIDIFSPCVTFNLDNTHNFFKERIKKLEDEDHDVTSWAAACEKAMVWGDEIYIGKFYHLEAEKESLTALEPVLRDGPVAKRTGGLTGEQADRIVRRML